MKETILRLLDYCETNDWAGYDPYDALNSRVFRSLPFLDFKIFRLFLTQAVKRSSINLRPLLLVPKKQNPKGNALFLSSLVSLRRSGLIPSDLTIEMMTDKLLSLKSPDSRYSCWGYSFDWQTRGDLVPEGSPNIICTSFAANALLDAYEHTRNPRCLREAKRAAEFILDVLFWRDETTPACFSYTPLGHDAVHNANLLGAALLCRVARAAGISKFIEPALAAARFSVSRQDKDGSWPYGESPRQKWIDNFHTGYNLVALKKISEYVEISEFDEAICKGLDFYLKHFFRKDGAPKYYHDAVYPIDIHSVAQSIITLVEFSHFDYNHNILAESIFSWARDNMFNDRIGYFFYQLRPLRKVRIPFIRWSQAWMLYALTALNESSHKTSL